MIVSFSNQPNENSYSLIYNSLRYYSYIHIANYETIILTVQNSTTVLLPLF